jgi:hypothetical protein
MFRVLPKVHQLIQEAKLEVVGVEKAVVDGVIENAIAPASKDVEDG